MGKPAGTGQLVDARPRSTRPGSGTSTPAWGPGDRPQFSPVGDPFTAGFLTAAVCVLRREGKPPPLLRDEGHRHSDAASRTSTNVEQEELRKAIWGRAVHRSRSPRCPTDLERGAPVDKNGWVGGRPAGPRERGEP